MKKFKHSIVNPLNHGRWPQTTYVLMFVILAILIAGSAPVLTYAFWGLSAVAQFVAGAENRARVQAERESAEFGRLLDIVHKDWNDKNLELKQSHGLLMDSLDINIMLAQMVRDLYA